MPEKTIDGWLVVDWKQGQHRTRQSKPGAGELGKNELLAEIQIDVHVPEVEVPKLAVDIDVPEPQVRAATLEAIDEADLPDWTDEAAAVVARHEDRVADLDGKREHHALVNELTTEVLTSIETRPDPSQVRDFVRDLVREGVDA